MDNWISHARRHVTSVETRGREDAWEKLKLHLPEFLRYELLRAIPRDVLESGKGTGNEEEFISKLSRAEHLLALRVHRNSYPIVSEDDDKMQFR